MILVWNKIRAFSLLHPRSFLFCLAFFYVVLAGLFIQFIFLPYLAPPGMSSGDGLLSAGYDSENFHSIALSASKQIRELGWSVWSLKPENQVVSGIASIFYTLITPKPWVLLPLNGFLHGIASLALLEMLSIIVGNQKLALFSSLPFVLFPSSLLWNAQLHNENYAIPGVLLFLCGWIYLADIERALTLNKSWKVILIIVFGSLITWVVRDYIMSLLHLLVLMAIILLIILQTIQFIKKQIQIKILLSYVGLLVLIWLVSSPNLFGRIAPGFINSSKSDIEHSSSGLNIETPEQSKKIPWSKTIWLPQKVDKEFEDLSHTRVKFIQKWSFAGSQIDTEIIFSSAPDIIKYIPRALEIGFLAPFPSEWLGNGYQKGASLIRKVSGAEMIITYICLLGLFFSLWHFQAKIEIWILSAITIGMLIVYSCAIPNVGSLYRFRYPYLMPLVCLGLSGVILAYRQHKKNRLTTWNGW